VPEGMDVKNATTDGSSQEEEMVIELTEHEEEEAKNDNTQVDQQTKVQYDGYH
jgi:hypothetical protein